MGPCPKQCIPCSWLWELSQDSYSQDWLLFPSRSRLRPHPLASLGLVPPPFLGFLLFLDSQHHEVEAMQGRISC